MSDVLARIKRLFRLRFAVLYPLAAYVLFYKVPDDNTAVFGMVFMAAGMVMRVWSNGYAIKLGKLTTSGPYAFVRNPLYVGTGLILLGVVVMLDMPVVGALSFAVLALVYTRTIRNEEKMLADKFGAPFLAYRAKVPAMWPRLTPYPDGEKWAFSMERVWFSREHKVVLWVTIMAIGFYLKKEFLAHGVLANVRTCGMVAAACFLALLDLFGEYIRHQNKKGDV